MEPLKTQANRDPGTVLVADDVDIMRITCERALQKEGFRVVSAATGGEALKLINAEKFEVALLDIRMPGLSGVDLLRRIKDSGREVEVIMMTAYADAEVAQESLNLGAAALLMKPFEDVSVMVDEVRRSMARVKRRLGEPEDAARGLETALLKAQLLSPEQIRSAKLQAQESGQSLRRAILSLGLLKEEDMDWAVSNYLDIPYVRVTEGMLDLDLIRNFPPALARRFACLPLFRDGKQLHLVTGNPFDPRAAEEVAAAFGVTPVFSMGSEMEIASLLRRHYGKPSGEGGAYNDPARLGEFLSGVEFVEVAEATVAPDGQGGFTVALRGRVRPRSE
jgi:CheY-like chemotaxis protein